SNNGTSTRIRPRSWFIGISRGAEDSKDAGGVKQRTGPPGWETANPACYNLPIMATKPTKSRSEFDVIEPIGKRIVIRKDDNKRQTRSGIVLPDTHEIPVITGRVIAISKAIENDEDQTIRQYDKILFDPREAIPVEREHDN